MTSRFVVDIDDLELHGASGSVPSDEEFLSWFEPAAWEDVDLSENADDATGADDASADCEDCNAK